MREFWMCFVPLFVAVDAVGSLPMFLNFTRGMPLKAVASIIIESVLTASIVAMGFLFAGRAILRLLGISIADFMVAGGIVIFVIAISDLISSEELQSRLMKGSLGAVPLGVPLITGPAVLTTSLLLLETYGFAMTAGALIANNLIVGLLFLFSSQLIGLLGNAGSTVVSKVANLLMASIGVMIIRKGITQIFSGVSVTMGT